MRYDWERGTLTLPEDAWNRFREALSQAEQRRNTRLYALAQQLHALLLATTAGAIGDVAPALPAVLELGKDPLNAGLFAEMRQLNGQLQVVQSLRAKHDSRKLAEPAKEHFSWAQPHELDHLTVGESAGSIGVDHVHQQVTWSVYWGEDAVRRARDSYYGRIFFQLLKTVQWTRGTGGLLIGSDETHQTLNGIGNGRDYVTAGYGPLGYRG